MGFNFFKWLIRRRSRDAPDAVTMEEFFDLATDAYIRDLAFQACVNLVGNALSKCEVKTLDAGKEAKGAEYHLWNLSPNQNQSSGSFWSKLVYRMFYDRAALVVENGGRLYVADSWDRKEYALYDDVFSGVTVGDFTFSRTFAASDVLFFEHASKHARKVVDGLYESYAKLIAYGMRGYESSRGTKGTLELDANAAGDKKFEETFESIKNEGFRKFAEADSAILPLWRGMKFTQLGAKTYSADNTRDIRAMIDDVTDFTARAFGIPPVLLNGKVQDVDSATAQFLTFCVDPLADSIAEEINRKRYTFAEWQKGSRVEIDTSRIKHVDILEAAGSIEKLVSSGALCINDIRGILGKPLINEPWAWQHWITKNYSAISEALEALEGPEKGEKS